MYFQDRKWDSKSGSQIERKETEQPCNLSKFHENKTFKFCAENDEGD